VIWSLYEGERETGYTIHKISAEIDGGDIIFQERVPIDFRASLAETVSHTVATLYRKSAASLARLLADSSQLSSGTPQKGGSSYTTPSIRQMARIYRRFRELKRERLR
jgi:methionyl-tRNA formyltransferase